MREQFNVAGCFYVDVANGPSCPCESGVVCCRDAKYHGRVGLLGMHTTVGGYRVATYSKQ